MEKKSLKKLTLKKEVITNLSNGKMLNVKGGGFYTEMGNWFGCQGPVTPANPLPTDSYDIHCNSIVCTDRWEC